MRNRLFEFFISSVRNTLILYGLGVAFAGLFAPFIEENTFPSDILGVAFGLALFGMPLIGPIATLAGVAVTFVTCFRSFTWGHVLLLALIAAGAGFAASWIFQYVGPFEFYHEGDGRVPGGAGQELPPIRMASPTTTLALCASFCAVSLCALISRRATAQHVFHSA